MLLADCAMVNHWDCILSDWVTECWFYFYIKVSSIPKDAAGDSDPLANINAVMISRNSCWRKIFVEIFVSFPSVTCPHFRIAIIILWISSYVIRGVSPSVSESLVTSSASSWRGSGASLCSSSSWSTPVTPSTSTPRTWWSRPAPGTPVMTACSASPWPSTARRECLGESFYY